MNKKQISCLVAGLCCLATLLAFCVWASVGGFFQKLFLEKNETVPVIPIKDRRGFIFSRSAEHPETVRIIASVATPKPVHHSSPAPSSPNRLRKTRRPNWRTTTTSEEPSQLIRLPTSAPRSFFDLPDSDVWRPSFFPESRTHDAPHFNGLSQPLNAINWERDSLNMTKLLGIVSRIFGVNLAKEDPHLFADRDAISADRSSWVTLSYLSLSVFLLRQMDRLLKLQSEPLDPLLMEERGRSLLINPEPWVNNSLNLLFTEPSNSTDVQHVVTTVDLNEDKPSDYFWAIRNILKASEESNGEGLDCIWSAYCVELGNRANLSGISGTISRMNGIVLKMVTGQLSPSNAVAKLMRSMFEWDGMECSKLFPRCKPEDALTYLINLATKRVPAQ